jgi:hypothetical protein
VVDRDLEGLTYQSGEGYLGLVASSSVEGRSLGTVALDDIGDAPYQVTQSYSAKTFGIRIVQAFYYPDPNLLEAYKTSQVAEV